MQKGHQCPRKSGCVLALVGGLCLGDLSGRWSAEGGDGRLVKYGESEREKDDERRTNHLDEVVIGDSVFILGDWIRGLGFEDHFRLIVDVAAAYLRWEFRR